MALAVELARRRGLAIGTTKGQDFSRWRGDPVGFSREALGVRWWARQEEIALAVRDCPEVAVEAAHSLGKTFGAGSIVLWWMMIWEDAKVITTATTYYQVVDLLWREIRQQFGKAKLRLPGEIFRSRLEMGPERFAVGISPREDINSPEASYRFAGYHSEHLLIVLDEAAGVRPDIWAALDALAIGEGNRKLAIGNPLFSEGPFWEACHGSGKQWKTIRISCLDSPNLTGGGLIPGLVGPEWVAEQIEGHCEPCGEGEAGAFQYEGGWWIPDRWFEAHALARPPTSAAGNKVIPEAWLDAVMEQ